MEGKDVYILLAFALFRRRRPVLPHRRSPCRFTGDHLAHHVDDALPGLTPSTANFPTGSTEAFVNEVSIDEGGTTATLPYNSRPSLPLDGTDDRSTVYPHGFLPVA